MSDKEEENHKKNQSVDLFGDMLQKNQKSLFEDPLAINSYAFDKSLNLENSVSLNLMARHSIEQGLPIPKNMLSQSEDVFQLQYGQYQQNQQASNHLNILDDAHEELINKLNLREYFHEHPDYQGTENTKNVLRNFGNAQNSYCLYHEKARQQIRRNIEDPTLFDEWVRTLKLENFDHFRQAWTSTEVRLFTRVYKRLCWQFYTENAVPYVLSSRIKKSETKNSHLRYIYRFLEGLQNPSQFTYFKRA